MSTQAEKIARRLTALSAAGVVAVAPPPAPQKKTGPDKREAPRRHVFRQGKLLIPGGASLQCMIMDWSENGARIQMDGVDGLAEFLTLKVLSTGMLKRARVMWRRGNMAGLSFLLERKSQFGNSRL